MTTPAEREVLTPEEVAAMFRVDVKNLARWEANGKFKPSFRTPGGHRRYYRDEVEAVIRGSRP